MNLNAANPSSAVLAGVVLNAVTGAPVYRALVRANGRAILTDHEGRFQFDQIPSSGSVTIEVRKPGFYFGSEWSTSSRTLRLDQAGSPVVLRLRPEALITGTVTAGDGTPLPRTPVSALRSIYNQTGHQMVSIGQAVTNARGEFRISVPAGEYRVQTNFSPRLPGSSDAVLPVAYPTDPYGVVHVASGSEEHVELHPVVSRTYPVRLKVESNQEQGFSSFLMAKATDGSVFPVRMMRDESSGSGEVMVALPPGTFTLIGYSNRGDQMEYGETSVTVGGSEGAGFVLRLSSVPPVPVQVLVDPESTSDKTPPTAQQLGIVLENVQSDRMGVFPFPSTARQTQETTLRGAPGTYRLASRAYGQWFVKAATYGTTDLLRDPMTISWGAASGPIVLTISNRTGGLQGTTQLKGAAQPAWVYAIPSAVGSVPFYETRSNADGTFHFPYLPPGTYQVIAFEDRSYANLADGKTVGTYSTYAHGTTVLAGETATISLDTVADAEMRQ